MSTPFGPTPSVGSDAGFDGGEDSRGAEYIKEHGGSDPERAENAIELKEVEGLSLGRIVLRRFLRHRAAMISVAVLALCVILSFSSIGLNAFGIHTLGWWKWTYDAVPDPQNGTQPTLGL